MRGVGIRPLRRLACLSVLCMGWAAPASAQMMSQRLEHGCSPRERIELRKERYDKAEIDELCSGPARDDLAAYERTATARFCITPAGSCRDPAAPPGGNCACFTPAGVFLGVAR